MQQWAGYLYISLGAVIGANLRFVVSRWCARLSPAFPYGTLLINITGSFLLAAFMTLATERVLLSPKWRLLFAIGFCGAYTTMSSFAFETVALFEQGQWWSMAMNIVGNNLLCLGAAVAGIAAVRAL